MGGMALKVHDKPLRSALAQTDSTVVSLFMRLFAGSPGHDGAPLADFKSLFFLIANNNPLTDAALKHIEQMAELRTMHIRKTKITANGLRSPP